MHICSVAQIHLLRLERDSPVREAVSRRECVPNQSQRDVPSPTGCFGCSYLMLGVRGCACVRWLKQARSILIVVVPLPEGWGEWRADFSGVIDPRVRDGMLEGTGCLLSGTNTLVRWSYGMVSVGPHLGCRRGSSFEIQHSTRMLSMVRCRHVVYSNLTLKPGCILQSVSYRLLQSDIF